MIGPQAQANPDDTCAGDILLEPTGNVPTGKYQKIITRVIKNDVNWDCMFYFKNDVNSRQMM